MSRETSRGTLPWSWLLALLLLGFSARWVGLGERALWLDEWVSLEVASRPVSAILRGEVFDNHTPPLYYLLLHFWLRVVPEGPVGLRSLSVILDLACLGLLASTLTRWVGRREGLAVGCAYALSPYAVRLAQEGRMYSLLMLSVVACFALTLELQRDDGRYRRVWGLAAAATAALYTHYYSILTLATLHGVVAWRLRDRPGERRRWWTAMGASAVLFLPWLPVVVELLRTGGQAFRSFGALVLPHALLRITAGYSVMPVTLEAKRAPIEAVMDRWPLAVMVVVSGLGSFALGAARAQRLPRVGILLPSLVAVPPVLALGISWIAPSLDARYLSICFPFFLALAVLGFFGDAPAGARAGIGILFAGLMAYGAAAQFLDPDAGTTPWRKAMAVLEAEARAGAPVVVSPPFYAPVVDRLVGPSRDVRAWKRRFPVDPSTAGSGVWLVEVAFLSDRSPGLERRGWRVASRELLSEGNGVRLSRLEVSARPPP